MMLDVESVGLHGEGFAYGYVIEDGPNVIEEGFAIANPDTAVGTQQDRDWLKKNVFPWINAMSLEFPPDTADSSVHLDPTTGVLVTLCNSPEQLRENFWLLWTREKARGTQLWADVS